MQKTTIAAAMVMVALLNTGCEPETGRPKPNPTRPISGGKRGIDPLTPAPIVGDPNPSDAEHEYTVYVAWSPANNFIEIDWEIGSDDGPALPYQRSGGKFSKSGRARRSSTIMVFGTVYKGTKHFPIEIKCTIREDGHDVIRRENVVYDNKIPLGVVCEVP